MIQNKWIRICALFFVFSGYAKAQESVDRIDDQHVILKAWVSHVSNEPVVNEQVMINVEVMTDTWFTKGTYIHRFDIDNAMVLSNSMSTVNSTERLNGKVYSKQHWQIETYPLTSGIFEVPKIEIDIVTKGSHGHLPHSLVTPPLRFNVKSNTDVTMPNNEQSSPSLANRIAVGHNVQLSQDWNITHQYSGEYSDGRLEVGDSIERIVSITAEDTVGMLLPEMLSPLSEQDESFLVFPVIKKTQDEVNRGLRQASQIEIATYVVKQAGEVILPAISLNWWDPHSQIMRVLTLPEKSWKVSHTLASFWEAYNKTFLVALLLVMATAVVTRRLYLNLKSRPRSAWWLLLVAIMKQDIALYETAIYRILLRAYHRRTFVIEGHIDNALYQVQFRYRIRSKIDVVSANYVSRITLIKLFVLLIVEQ